MALEDQIESWKDQLKKINDKIQSIISDVEFNLCENKDISYLKSIKILFRINNLLDSIDANFEQVILQLGEDFKL